MKKSTNKSKERDIILFVGYVAKNLVESIKKYSKKEKRKWKIGVIYDIKNINPKSKKDLQNRDDLDFILSCDMSSHTKILKTILPYQEKILAVTCRSDRYIPSFEKLIPHLPYLRTPTTESLKWSTDKILMRRMLFLHDKKITPSYTVVHDAKKASIKKIEEKVGFPLVVKPAGLGASLLVSICYHKEELEKVLKLTFKKINGVYKKMGGRGESASVLVEQFMEGETYSVDVYVNSRGKVYFCPFVHVKTGKSIGFDDFFGYQQLTPTLLKPSKIKNAQEVSEKAVHALGLRSSSAHIELVKTEAGWKIIELGPRIGGFRYEMYKYSYGIDHVLNDIKIHIPEKPTIPKRIKGYTAVMKFFAKKEGVLTKLTGIKKALELKSFKNINVNKKIGDECKYAKNGGSSVFNIKLFNKNRSDLLADIRRLEQMIEIVTK